jgi:hypothetical protein
VGPTRLQRFNHIHIHVYIRSSHRAGSKAVLLRSRMISAQPDRIAVGIAHDRNARVIELSVNLQIVMGVLPGGSSTTRANLC